MMALFLAVAWRWRAIDHAHGDAGTRGGEVPHFTVEGMNVAVVASVKKIDLAVALRRKRVQHGDERGQPDASADEGDGARTHPVECERAARAVRQQGVADRHVIVQKARPLARRRRFIRRRLSLHRDPISAALLGRRRDAVGAQDVAPCIANGNLEDQELSGLERAPRLGDERFEPQGRDDAAFLRFLDDPQPLEASEAA